MHAALDGPEASLRNRGQRALEGLGVIAEEAGDDLREGGVVSDGGAQGLS